MFDFLRKLTKSAEEKRQEAVAAYLDGALNDRERQRFEQEMAQDEALRGHVEQLLLIKQSLRQLPQRSVPRNFVLDPAKYGRPARQPWVQAYPVLRTATAMAAFFFVFAVVAGLFTSFGAGGMAAPAADVAQLDVAAEEPSAEMESMEVTAFESIVADEAAATDVTVEMMPEAAAPVEEVVVEEAVEEAMMEMEPSAEAPPALVETAVPITTDSAQQNDEEAGIENGADIAPDLPRVTPPTPLPDEDSANAQPAEAADGGRDTESVETTAVLPEETMGETRATRSIPPLLWLQLGLGGLLLLLVALTVYARRQR